METNHPNRKVAKGKLFPEKPDETRENVNLIRLKYFAKIINPLFYILFALVYFVSYMCVF